MSLVALLLACAAKTTTPATATGFTDASGGTVTGDVSDFLNRTEPQIIQCYMATLSDPSQADDSVQLQFVIEDSGKIGRVVTRQSTITDPRFTTCVESLMTKERVSNPDGKTFAVTRDYNFRPAK
jgi:hypothetical protein